MHMPRTDARILSGHKRADVREQDDERDRLEIDALAAAVGAGDNERGQIGPQPALSFAVDLHQIDRLVLDLRAADLRP